MMFGIHLRRKKTQNWIKACQPSVSFVSSFTVQHNSELFSFACEMTLNRSLSYFASILSVYIILLEEDLLIYSGLTDKNKRKFFFPSFFPVSYTSVHSVAQVLLY